MAGGLYSCAVPGSGFLSKQAKAAVLLDQRSRMDLDAKTESGREIYEVDLNHGEILRKPDVRIFAEKLSQRVARVSRSTPETAASLESQEALLVSSLGQQSWQNS
jgi:hypothetical protein